LALDLNEESTNQKKKERSEKAKEIRCIKGLEGNSAWINP